MITTFITGITGQDGSYLADECIKRGHHVVGLKRRSSTSTIERLSYDVMHSRNFEIVEGDVADYVSMSGLVDKYRPTYFINTAAQSHVGTSFEQPVYTSDVNYMGCLNCLEAIRKYSPDTQFLQCSTSEMFGGNYTRIRGENLQTEQTPFAPNSPYAVAKLAAHNMVRVYRESYGIKGQCAITFNHESPRRGYNFVTRKVTRYVAELDYHRKHGNIITKLKLGNLNATRDWSHAKDVISAFLLMLESTSQKDYVIASGRAYTIRELCRKAFSLIGINNWEDFVEVDPRFYRPCEVPYLRGDPSLIKKELGWKPTYNFDSLIEEMFACDKEEFNG